MIREVSGDPELPIYTTPTQEGEGEKAVIYLRAFPLTEAQKSWLRGNGFRELTVTFTDLQELLLRGKG
jgi:hypothetical protein